MAAPSLAERSHDLDERRWRAVLERDGAEREAFVYGVKTTGVFCRPACPSRRPRRENVRFFDTGSAARAAGFRACRRCRPEESAHDVPEAVLAACRIIESESDRIPTLEELGRAVSLSPSHLQRVFKRSLGVSPRAYADALRVERLRRELRDGEGIAGALYGAGYGSSSRLYETARDKLGMTPHRYRERARGERIRYATVPAPPLGRLLVAATDRGICAVRLGDGARQLVAELRDEFPEATFERAPKELAEALHGLVHYVSGAGPLPDLPHDVAATAFERRVWEAIREIPTGETASYSQLAQRVGSPKAARAVARACARNPLALLVPCHRVVPKGGGAGGYRWGTQRKRTLLRLEREAR